mgnify:CR=1 FL=1
MDLFEISIAFLIGVLVGMFAMALVRANEE